MTTQELIIMWMEDEAESQRAKLRSLLKAKQFNNFHQYQQMVKMRQELVAICEKYLDENFI